MLLHHMLVTVQCTGRMREEQYKLEGSMHYVWGPSL